VNFADAEKIAATVLYEGYILYPYRPTSTKNVQRWNFGTLYPRDYAEAQCPAESCRMIAECLVAAKGDAMLGVRARLLQLVRRQRLGSKDWDEGVERCCDLTNLSLQELTDHPLQHEFAFDAGEPSSPKSIHGQLHVEALALREGLYKLSVQLLNNTPLAGAIGPSREDAMLQAFVSAHALLGITGGEFISLLDPAEVFREAATACRNVGVFPVLVGESSRSDMMLCSPIILYDYPQIAPESAGDFFDGTEMDEMLALRVLTLTEEEKQEMRAGDDRARRILERTETLPEDFLMKVHGTIRGMRPVAETAPKPFAMDTNWDPLAERPAVDCVHVFGVELRAGDRVRLWPQKKADIMDMALTGKLALIEAIEQDFEDNIQLAVVLDDDPGRDLGMMRQPGHRFFFSPEEVEPWKEAEKA
jgi:hypothetical protein